MSRFGMADIVRLCQQTESTNRFPLASHFGRRQAAVRRALLAGFCKLLLCALRVPDVARGFLVCPALFPRLAQAAR